MTKKDLFIIHLLQSVLQGKSDESVSVLTMPVIHKIESNWCVRLKLYVYSECSNTTDILLDMVITGLEMRYMSQFLKWCDYSHLSAKIEHHRLKYFEDEGFHVVLRPSLRELWES